MSGKYLALKFLFVAILLALCLGSIFWGNGLRTGPDISGGYSMIFEVRVDKSDSSDIIDRVIATLKNRIDPSGLSSLEWTPLKNNRFEVRMPAASEESKRLRNDYLQAREDLLEQNISRSDVREVARMSRSDRKAAVAELTSGDEVRRRRLHALLESLDQLTAAEETRRDIDRRIAAVTSDDPQKLSDLQQQKLAADQRVAEIRGEYRRRWQALEARNVDPRTLRATLQRLNDLRVRTDEEEKADIRRRFEEEIEELKSEHPSQADLIARVADVYAEWAKVRRPLESPNDLKRLIRKAGVLEFRIAPYHPRFVQERGLPSSPLTESQIVQYVNSLEEQGPEALQNSESPYAWFPYREGEGQQANLLVTHDFMDRRFVLLSNRPDEKMVQTGDSGQRWEPSATSGSDEYGAPAVNFGLDSFGARMMSRLTSANIGRPMAILLDDEVYSAPTIQSTISSRGQITGKFTYQEVQELAQTIAAGRLPGKVSHEPVSETVFGPALGAVNLKKGFRAGIIGLIVVAVFMLVYYLICGFIADAALLMNVILVLGAMSLFQAVLTLPGIAGVILTIGMAVDANVLIFERLREEQDKGHPVGQALKNAYERAFSAIFDANVTTLLICLFLFVVFGRVGMEEVRGFAITLGLGVAFSMFTALVVTRWMFQTLVRLRIVRKPLPMLRLIPRFNVNWIGKRYLFWTVSLVLVVLGVGSLIWQGGDILGIEFSSGTQAVLKFKDDAVINGRLPDDEIVRRTFTETAEQSGSDKLINARVETIINENNVEDFLRLYGNDAGVVTLESWKHRGKNQAFFDNLDTDDSGTLTRTELQQRLPQTTYQVSTTENRAGVVRQVANDTFGTLLQRRLPVQFELAEGETLESMSVTLSPDGTTRITPQLTGNAAAAFHDDLDDFQGGILMVVENLDPAITADDLRSRIRDIRLQPDFGQVAINPYRVIGLTPDDEGKGYTSFAVLSSPVDSDSIKTPSARRQFTDMEREVLTEALRREEAMVLINFDPAIAGQIAQLAIVVVVISWLAIVVYLWLRFGSIRWGLAAVICLVHDVVIVIGLVAVSGWLYDTIVGEALGLSSFKIDRAMVAALLTVIGYSVNDTIVVFDRIRENRGKLRTVSADVINNSVNQTLPRTLLTSFTTFLVVFIMYVWGGAGIHAFSYALLMGIVFGTYSSIAIASPLLLGFKKALIVKVTSEQEQETEIQTSS